MSSQSHDPQKAPLKPAVTPQSSQIHSRPFANAETPAFTPKTNQFESRPFAIQTNSTSSSPQQESPDIETQFEQAKSFDYDLAKIPLVTAPASTPSLLQAKLTSSQSLVQRHSIQDAPTLPQEEEEEPVAQPQSLVQRHSIQDAPSLPQEEEEEQVAQPKSLVQRHSIQDAPSLPQEEDKTASTQSLLQRQVTPGQSAFGKASVLAGQVSQSEVREGMLQRDLLGGLRDLYQRTMYGSVTFTPPEIAADKKATSQAKADRLGATATQWGIIGPSHGSTIDAAGVITAGQITKGGETATVKVKATDAKKSSAYATGELTLRDPHYKDRLDYEQFVAAKHQILNFKPSSNFGKFDVNYQPAANRLDIDMKVKFAFPDDLAVPGESKADAAARDVRQEQYRKLFINQVTTAWSGRYTFKNVREPQSVWGKLNPTTVKLNVTEVKNNQHFLINVNAKTMGTANVTGAGVTTLYKGDDTPTKRFNPGTEQNELRRVKKILPRIRFDNNSAAIDAKYQPGLQFLADYLKRINNPQFKIDIVGHASATGDAAKNQLLSDQRAKAVEAALTGAGLIAPHQLSSKGVGQKGAAASSSWRKVDMTPSVLVKGWQNIQDVTVHEFGHMIGLDDEYDSGRGAITDHYALTKKAFGEKYANEVAKVNVGGATDQASVMEGGNDVRLYHYVTFWDALVQATLKAPVPNPKFGYDDWKFIG
ncbi:MAG TPA: OmpA family protein [Allocoleopsis sp.]